MKQESTFFKRKLRALHKIHIKKNLELTANIAARQEYSTGISEAQEYSKRNRWSVSLSHTRMLGSNKYSSKQNKTKQNKLMLQGKIYWYEAMKI